MQGLSIPAQTFTTYNQAGPLPPDPYMSMWSNTGAQAYGLPSMNQTALSEITWWDNAATDSYDGEEWVNSIS